MYYYYVYMHTFTLIIMRVGSQLHMCRLQNCPYIDTNLKICHAHLYVCTHELDLQGLSQEDILCGRHDNSSPVHGGHVCNALVVHVLHALGSQGHVA